MCQLYAYGNKYLKGNGKLFLIYLESETFSEPLPVFKFDDEIKLWVVPFKWGWMKFLFQRMTDLSS